MKRFAWVVPLLAGLWGCGGGGGGEGKPACDGVGSCGTGNYCAKTPDGNVCWPDSVGPAVSDVHVACSDTPCKRSSTLHVTATVTDDVGVGGATATIDLDPGHPRAMAPGAGGLWQLDVPLTELPFPFFEHPVSASVVGTDEAHNATEPVLAAEQLSVTRLAWTRSLKGATPLALSSPAMLKDGRIVLSGSDGKLYFVAKDGESSESTTVSTSALSGPPAVSGSAVWVGTRDGMLSSVSLQGKTGRTCATGGPLIGAPAVMGARVLASAEGVSLAVADEESLCSLADVAASAQPVIASSGRVFVPAVGHLRSLTVRPAGAFHDEWTGAPPAPTVGDVSAPPALDGQGGIWTTSTGGALFRTTESGTAKEVTLAPLLSANGPGAIVVSSDVAVVGDRLSAGLRKVSATTGDVWTAALIGAPTLSLALTGDVPSLLVPTSRGHLFLLRESDGTIIWSAPLTSSNQSLETPNIWTEPGAATSTAYLSGADGVLYAVIVDGALDTSAPWPKAYHDPQNTSNAGYVP